MEAKVILKDLCALIRKSTIHYNENCIQGDYSLNDEFKRRYKRCLLSRGYSVDFYNYTAVITTSAGNYILAPNQWFVVSAYAVGVYDELMKYKKYLFEVCSYLAERPRIYVPKLRDDTANINRAAFFEACDAIFADYTPEERNVAKTRLWRFATDYSWWSGNKTIDRTDFYYSVILNMLSLVNISQAYVAEIVSDYGNSDLKTIVSNLEGFTDEFLGPTYEIADYHNPSDNLNVTTHEEPTKQSSDDDASEIVISVRSRP